MKQHHGDRTHEIDQKTAAMHLDQACANHDHDPAQDQRDIGVCTFKYGGSKIVVTTHRGYWGNPEATIISVTN